MLIMMIDDEGNHFLFPLTKKIWRFFGLDFSSSFFEMTQSWFLSKYLKICLRFLGVFFKNWLEIWYSLNLMVSSLSMSKVSKKWVVTSYLVSPLILESWASSSTSPTQPSMASRTEIIKKNYTLFGSDSLREVIDIDSSTEFSELSGDFFAFIISTWFEGIDFFDGDDSIMIVIHESDERSGEVFIPYMLR